jgi:hypothetical protein
MACNCAVAIIIDYCNQYHADYMWHLARVHTLVRGWDHGNDSDDNDHGNDDGHDRDSTGNTGSAGSAGAHISEPVPMPLIDKRPMPPQQGSRNGRRHNNNQRTGARADDGDEQKGSCAERVTAGGGGGGGHEGSLKVPFTFGAAAGSPLPASAYHALRDGRGTVICRVISGLWQLGGGHGYRPVRESVLKDMDTLVEVGALPETY